MVVPGCQTAVPGLSGRQKGRVPAAAGAGHGPQGTRTKTPTVENDLDPAIFPVAAQSIGLTQGRRAYPACGHCRENPAQGTMPLLEGVTGEIAKNNHRAKRRHCRHMGQWGGPYVAPHCARQRVRGVGAAIFSSAACRPCGHRLSIHRVVWALLHSGKAWLQASRPMPHRQKSLPETSAAGSSLMTTSPPSRARKARLADTARSWSGNRPTITRYLRFEPFASSRTQAG